MVVNGLLILITAKEKLTGLIGDMSVIIGLFIEMIMNF